LGCQVIPGHPSKPEILGTATYPDVASIPGDIDLVIILVRDPFPALESGLAKKVAWAIVFSAGFGEVGTAEGRAAEARLSQLASGPMRVIGPNTNLNMFEPWPSGFPGKKLASPSSASRSDARNRAGPWRRPTRAISPVPMRCTTPCSNNSV
jgi:hypothetical protein